MTKEKDKRLANEQLLLEASRLGNIKQLEFILAQFQQNKAKKKTNPLASLRKSVGPNSIRDAVTGFTCLHHAALNGHTECVRLILDHGAKLNSVDYKGSSALHLAAWAGNLAVVRCLLNYRPSSPKESQVLATESPLYSSNGKQAADIDLCNNDNQTPLSLAAQFGHNEVVAELLRHQANLQLRNTQFESPLELACLNGRLGTVQLLLDSAPTLVAELRRPAALVLLRNPHQAQAQLRFASSTAEPSSSSSAAAAMTATHNRRPSGGWSSLLRGRRDSAGATGTGGQQAAMLQRRPIGSLQQRSQQQQQHLEATSSPYRSHQYGKQMSVDWLVGAGDNDPLQQPEFCERLLDHSPLHYAVRRGHLDIVNVLLRGYKANILQVTTLGGVLHEVALNNGKHCDVIGLLFNFISQLDPDRRLDTLERFLNLKNAQNKTVFEVLNEINNRSAQEIKRLIHEFGDQTRRSVAGEAPLRNVDTNRDDFSLVDRRPMDESAQDERLFAYSAQQLSDMKQIETFATIKRSNNKSSAKRSNLNDAFMFTSSAINNASGQQQQQMQLPYGTQTIDRRLAKSVSSSGGNNASGRHQWVTTHSLADSKGFIANQQMNPAMLMLQQQQQQHLMNQQRAFQQQQQQVAQPMTRSVSNLSQLPSRHYDLRLQQQQQQQQRVDSNEDYANMMWRHWLARGSNQSGADTSSSEQPAKSTQRRQRSRSRDFSSNLKDALELQRYELEADENRWPPSAGAVARGSDHPANFTHLVRSQTDCSHLMGRFFNGNPGNHSSSTGCRDENNGTGGSGGNQANESIVAMDANQISSSQHHSSDRKMINRHYHVYEHEFYPPRILPQQQQQLQQQASGFSSQSCIVAGGSGANQMIAVVPPLARLGDNRLSTRSAAMAPLRDRAPTQPNCQVTSSASFRQKPQQTGGASHPRVPPRPTDLQPTRNNSRLSLNIDPSAAPQQPTDLQQSVEVPSLASQQMNRFVCRHSRKSTIPQAHSFDLNTQTAASNSRCSSAIEHQKRQDLIELQRQLASQQTQQQQLNLNGHLSEPHLFETSRNALISDFNRMIGQELLNSNNTSGSVVGGQQSILTGVSLDMDKYGEQLTVSGTCVTIPDRPPPPSARSRLSLAQRQSREAAETTSSLDGSLTHSSSSLSSSSRPARVIYDLPGASDSQLQVVTAPRQLEAHLANQLTTPVLRGSKSTGPRAAMTEPPKERPPPPPTLSNPLQVLAGVDSGSNASNSNSNLSSASNNECTGLLKMASLSSNSSGSSSLQQQQVGTKSSVRNGTVLTMICNDPDSGVCTSNSPASLSHDSEGPLGTDGKETLESSKSKPKRELLSLVTDGPVSQTSLSSPPSPNTAQLCIEEALMPLDKQPTQFVCQSTSPLTATTTNQHAPSQSPTSPDLMNTVGRWLGSSATSSSKPEADYENCIALQEQLRETSEKLNRPNSISCDEMLPVDSSRLTDERPSHANGSDDGDEDYAASSCNDCESRGSNAVLDELNDRLARERHEVKLEIVVDSIERASSGDQVFYIDPSELKKIAMEKGKFQTDAQTLTDEDLCATIDKDSGYIRFTLRKRKNEHKERVEGESDTGSSYTNGATGAQAMRPTENSDSKTTFTPSQVAKKRTRFESSGDNSTEDSSKVCSSTSTRIKFKSNKQISSELKNWFAVNLTGLAEYSSKFLSNGYDNLRFLNHPMIVNDESLKRIGIDEESHRLLISERIREELPQVNVDELLDSKSSLVPMSDIFRVLQLDCVSQSSRNPENLDFSSSEIDRTLAELTKGGLVGHNARLAALGENLKARFGKKPAPMVVSKQVSTESAEMDLDASVASATSSSSKESIRSIVVAAIKPAQPAKAVRQESEDVDEDCSKTLTRQDEELEAEKKNQRDIVADAECERDLCELGDDTIESPKEVKPLEEARTASLVSEVARKLEEASNVTTCSIAGIGSVRLRPVAAARRFGSNSNKSTTVTDQEQKSQVLDASNKAPNEIDESQDQPARSKIISPMRPAMSVKQTAAIFGSPIKSLKTVNASLRLKSTEVKNQSNEEEHEFKRNLSAIRSKFDSQPFANGEPTVGKSLNEQPSQIVSIIKPSKPSKPPPPVKPVKLAIRKFNDPEGQQAVG